MSGGGTTGATGLITVNPGATLAVDNTGTATSNRLGSTRSITFVGGTLNYTGNATTATTETFGSSTAGTTTFNRGLTTINVVSNGQTTTLTLGAGNNVAPGQSGGPTGAAVVFEGNGLLSTGKSVIQSVGAGLLFNGGGTGGTGATTKSIMPYALVYDTTSGAVSFATANSSSGATGTTTSALRGLTVATEMLTNTFATPRLMTC